MIVVDIYVTDDDIRDGDPANCSECPIALAISRAVPNVAVHVFDDSIIIMPFADGESNFTLTLPVNACNFIHYFDNGLPVQPFSFQLDLDE